MILSALAMAISEPPLVTGFYRSHQIEIGAALQLDEGGKFHYQLDYGAVSEAAEGNWSFDGRAVYLTATRMDGAYQQKRFEREPLLLDGEALLLKRYDTVIRFELENLPTPTAKKLGE